jgi:3-methylfumaryl-CoA hydratase
MNIVDEEKQLTPTQAQCSIRVEICSLSTVRRVAAMLDLDPEEIAEGDPLPRGWQFILMAADTRRSLLRADGFPGLGVAMPDLGLPRLLLVGRNVSYFTNIPIGATVFRLSAIQTLTEKASNTGPMVIATIRHELRLRSEDPPALVETQTYFLLPATKGATSAPTSRISSEVAGRHIKTVVPDETLLFQYSALGFNSHKIHIDRAHARNVEGFPDLVVNGGIATLLLTEFLRKEMGIEPSSFKARHIAPLFCGSPITMVAKNTDGKWRLQAFDNRSTLAVDMEVETDEF